MPSTSRSNEASESKNTAAGTTQTAPMSVPTPGHQFLKKQRRLSYHGESLTVTGYRLFKANEAKHLQTEPRITVRLHKHTHSLTVGATV